MDAVEVQFDANDYFIMIDQTSGRDGGVYNIPTIVYMYVGEQ